MVKTPSFHQTPQWLNNFHTQGPGDFFQTQAAGVLGTCQSNGYVSAPRLVRSALASPAAPFQLTASPRGSLGNMVAKPLKNLTPGRGQLLLRVLAVGVNFRDVLNVLGMYPGDPGEPGGDVAGVVEAVGPGPVPFRFVLFWGFVCPVALLIYSLLRWIS
jgi:hypothetical protein